MATDVPKQIGTLVLDTQGRIEESSGVLEGDTRVAECLYQMLRDSKQICGPEPFQRVSVVFEACSYSMTISEDKIHIVKCKE